MELFNLQAFVQSLVLQFTKSFFLLDNGAQCTSVKPQLVSRAGCLFLEGQPGGHVFLHAAMTDCSWVGMDSRVHRTDLQPGHQGVVQEVGWVIRIHSF